MRVAVDAHRVALYPKSSHSKYLTGMLPHWEEDPRISEVHLILPRVARDRPLPEMLAVSKKIRCVYGYSRSDPGKGFLKLLDFQQRTVPRAIRETGADVFLSTFHLCPFFTGTVPVVTTIHDLCALDQPARNLSSLKWREIHRLQIKTACLKSKLLICVSKFTAAALKEESPSSAKRVRTVYNGYDTPAYGADEIVPRGHLFWIGDTGYRKNPELGFATLRLLRESRPGLRMIAVIPPYHIEQGRAMAAAAGVADAVDFRSGVEEADLDRLYREAGAVILPSRCEGFGYPLLEAMARGIPAIGYRRTPAIEIVGNCVKLPDRLEAKAFAEATSMVLDLDNGERTTLSEALRVRAGTFSTERMARETASVLWEAVNGSISEST